LHVLHCAEANKTTTTTTTQWWVVAALVALAVTAPPRCSRFFDFSPQRFRSRGARGVGSKGAHGIAPLVKRGV
jgi:hypothetical protein